MRCDFFQTALLSNKSLLKNLTILNQIISIIVSLRYILLETSSFCWATVCTFLFLKQGRSATFLSLKKKSNRPCSQVSISDD